MLTRSNSSKRKMNAKLMNEKNSNACRNTYVMLNSKKSEHLVYL